MPCASTASSPALTIGHSLASDFIAQNLIRRRSRYRWIMHLCLSGGCTLAFAVAFPLVFGWVQFEPSGDNAETYRMNLFGFGMDSFNVHSVKALVLFNALNISAALVLIGLLLAAMRRVTNAGERAVQMFFEDILPLILIFAVTATGLMLTISYKFMAGRDHSPMAVAGVAVSIGGVPHRLNGPTRDPIPLLMASATLGIAAAVVESP